jgi:secreted PhoX family phosphatase
MTDQSSTFSQLLQQRLTRRAVLQSATAAATLASMPSLLSAASSASLRFAPIAGSKEDAVVLPPGYTYDIIARWGDSLFSAVPDLDSSKLASGCLFESFAHERQRKQFGQNCDAIHFFPLDREGHRGLLCVNHEYTDASLMFVDHPGFGAVTNGRGRAYTAQHPEVVAVAQASLGVSVVEIVRAKGGWRRVKDSRFNRRITADTPVEIGGIARGSALMRTHADPSGTRALGTFSGCAGGETPWGTYLTAEENIQDFFANFAALEADEKADPFVVAAHSRWRMWSKNSPNCWEVTDARFDLTREPNEPFRFGWIVEIDPRRPDKAPVKRTSLGRFAHEGASPIVGKTGRVSVYMGDDDKFEHVYKFVSHERFDANNADGNRDLLDTGTLYVARFDANGSGRWLPLVYDAKGPLNAASGFRDQADVVIKARAAATLLGATPMDRPEDVEANPTSGRIYISCTNNELRTVDDRGRSYAGREVDAGPDAANPRGQNHWGHIIELREHDDDHASLEFNWEVFLLAGDPAGGKFITDLTELRSGLDRDSTYYAGFKQANELSPIGSPDNIGFGPDGNLWIVTDGPQPRGTNNGCYVCPTSGPDRGHLQQFMSGPVGAEICGCQFSPDATTLFLSIQHPGEGGSVREPRSHWPDGPGTQPRATVIAVRKLDGGRIGS